MQTEYLEVVYTAAMEREMVLAQQRPPAPLTPEVPFTSSRCAMRVFFSTHPGWWSIAQVATLLNLDRRLIISRINGMVYRGLVERELPPFKPNQNYQGPPQRYRWAGL